MATNWARWKTCGRNKSRSLWNEEIDIEDISIGPGFGCLFQALIEPNIYYLRPKIIVFLGFKIRPKIIIILEY
jgi:hypothetical protein